MCLSFDTSPFSLLKKHMPFPPSFPPSEIIVIAFDTILYVPVHNLGIHLFCTIEIE